MKTTEKVQVNHEETVTISRAEYERFRARISELESRVDMLMEALRLARHKRFGASSEKSEEPLMEQLSFLFNEAEVFAEEKEEAVTVVTAHRRRKKHGTMFPRGPKPKWWNTRWKVRMWYARNAEAP